MQDPRLTDDGLLANPVVEPGDETLSGRELAARIKADMERERNASPVPAQASSPASGRALAAQIRADMEEEMRGKEEGKAKSKSPMWTPEWLARSGERYGQKDATLYGMLEIVNPVAGWANSQRNAVASKYGNDNDGWASIQGLSLVGLHMALSHFNGREGVFGKEIENWNDPKRLRQILYHECRTYLTTRQGFEREEQERQPKWTDAGGLGTLDRAFKGTANMVGYMGQIAMGPKVFIPMEAYSRYAAGRAPEVTMGEDGSLPITREAVSRTESAAKALIGASLAYSIEKFGGEYVGGALRKFGGAIAPEAVKRIAAKAKGAMPFRLNSTMKAINKATGVDSLFDEIFVEELLDEATTAIGDLQYQYANTGMGVGERLGDTARNFLQVVPDFAVSMILLRGMEAGASIPHMVRDRKQLRDAVAVFDGNRDRADSLPDDQLADAVTEAVNTKITDEDQEEVSRQAFSRMGISPEEADSALKQARGVRDLPAPGEKGFGQAVDLFDQESAYEDEMQRWGHRPASADEDGAYRKEMARWGLNDGQRQPVDLLRDGAMPSAGQVETSSGSEEPYNGTKAIDIEALAQSERERQTRQAEERRASREEAETRQRESARIEQSLGELDAATAGLPQEFVELNRGAFQALETAIRASNAGKVRELVAVLSRKARNRKRQLRRKAARQNSEQAGPPPVADASSVAAPDTVNQAAQEAATSPANDKPEPTEAQKKAGNYGMGHTKVHGLDISIENPAGSVRQGTGKDGRQWRTEMRHHYGYIRGTVGRDKDHIDVFVNPDRPESNTVYVVNQVDPETGKFDEHKAMFGWDNPKAAELAYRANYEKGWRGAQSITPMTVDEFKEWAFSGKAKNGPAVNDGTRTLLRREEQTRETQRETRNAVQERSAAEVGAHPIRNESAGREEEGRGVGQGQRGEEVAPEEAVAGKTAEPPTTPQGRGLEEKTKAAETSKRAEKAEKPEAKPIPETTGKPAEKPKASPVHPRAMEQFLRALDMRDERALGDWLQPDNKALRAEFTKRTGVKLPPTLSKTREAIAEWASESAAKEKDAFADAIGKLDGKALGELLRPDRGELRAEFEKLFDVKLPPTWSDTKGWLLDWADKQKGIRAQVKAFAREHVAESVAKDTSVIGSVKNNSKVVASTTIRKKLSERVGELAQLGDKGMAAYKLVSADLDTYLDNWTDYVYNQVYFSPGGPGTLAKNDGAKRNAESVPEEGAEPTRGDTNTVFTKESYNAAVDDILDMLGGSLKAVGEGSRKIDIGKLTQAVGTVAGFHIESGIRDFLSFAREVKGGKLSQVWDQLSQYLVDGWNIARKALGSDVPAVSEAEAQRILGEMEAGNSETVANELESKQTAAEPPGSTRDEPTDARTDAVDSEGSLPRGVGGAHRGPATEPGQGTDGRRSAGNGGAHAAEVATGGPTSVPVPGTGGKSERGGGVQDEPADRTGGPRAVDSADEGRAGEVAGDGERDRGKLDGKPDPQPRNARNFRIEADTEIVPRGLVTRAEANLRAIEILRKLEKSDRPATETEKDALVRYVGWGGIPQVFDVAKAQMRDLASRNREWHEKNNPELVKQADAWDKQWGKRYDALREALTAGEWNAAAASMRNAHYTSREIIGAMWEGVRALGFRGGRVLETSAGIGHFLGLQPADLSAKTDWYAVEMDRTSGRILEQLYPDAEVQIAPFQQARIAPGSMDLVIGNFPFAQDLQRDAKKRWGVTTNLHGYFFMRSLETLRPGGIIVAITSSSTMDNEASRATRDWLAERADLLTAVRLPVTAFRDNANTEVTTDILVLRKRDAKQFPPAVGWVDVEPVTGSDGKPVTAKDGRELTINRWFSRQPHLMLGDMVWHKGRYGDEQEQALVGRDGLDVATGIREAMAAVPAGVFERSDSALPANPFAGAGAAEATPFSLVEKSGDFYEVRPDGTLEKKEWSEKKTGAVYKRAKAFVRLRDALVDAHNRQVDRNASDREVETARQKLVQEFDAYEKAHGSPWEQSTRQNFRNDPMYASMLALQDKQDHANGSPIYTRTGLLTGRTAFPMAERPDRAGSLEDAAAISENWTGSLDTSYIGKMLGIQESEAKARLLGASLAFVDPADGRLVPRADYLAGNVAEKLAAAERAQSDGGDYGRNVEALRTVQPAPIPIDLIQAGLSSSWMPPEAVQRWLEREYRIPYAKVTYLEGSGSWDVSGYESPKSKAAGTDYVPFLDLVKQALNLKTPKVYTGSKENRVFRPDLTQLAVDTQERIKQEFSAWLKGDRDMGDLAAKAYTRKMAGWAPKTEYPVDFRTYPGASPDIELRPWQKRAAQRAVREDVLLAHAVGAGKTFILATAAMEKKRLGLARKPMVVVQKSTLDQFTSEFKKLYPNARLLTITKQEIEDAGKRQLFLARAATGQWDAIIIPHSTFNRIPNELESERALIDEEIGKAREMLSDIRSEDEGSDSRSESPRAKDVQAKIDKLTDKLQTLNDKQSKEAGWTFEKMGVDTLLIDEAHEYKKLLFTTKMESVKGLDTSFSGKGHSLMVKLRHLRSANPNPSLVMATGTPISNTLTEVWTMMRYVAPQVLEKTGLTTFDDFASAFTETSVDVEVGMLNNPRMANRFRRYVNIPELSDLVAQRFDVFTPDDLENGLKAAGLEKSRPPVKGGEPKTEAIEPTPAVEAIFGGLAEEYERWSNLDPREKRNQRHVPLTINTKARKAALDPRLVDPDAPDDPNSKLNVAVRRAVEIYHEYADRKGTQLLFSDAQRSQENPDFDVHDELKRKLVEAGIPESEIALARDYKEAKLEAVMDKINQGTIRFFIGTTQNMGTGINVQERCIALHHLDAPYRPMDMEQREGRIVRQGNLFADEGVYIYRWGVKRTFDASLYQVLATKQAFIHSLLGGKITDRSTEAVAGDVQLNYEEATAALADNPAALRLFAIRSEIKRLQLSRRAFLEQRGNSRWRADSARRAAERTRQDMKEWPGILASWRKDWEGTPLRISVGGSVLVYDPKASDKTRSKQAEAIKDWIARTAKARGDKQEIEINGRGISVRPFEDGSELRFSVNPGMGTASEDATGTTHRVLLNLRDKTLAEMQNVVDRLPEQEQYYERSAAEYERQVAKPFPDEQRLIDLEQEAVALAQSGGKPKGQAEAEPASGLAVPEYDEDAETGQGYFRRLMDQARRITWGRTSWRRVMAATREKLARLESELPDGEVFHEDGELPASLVESHDRWERALADAERSRDDLQDAYETMEGADDSPEVKEALRKLREAESDIETAERFLEAIRNWRERLESRLHVAEANIAAEQLGREVQYRDVAETLGPADRARLLALGQRLFGEDWFALRERVLTPEGREVMGRYRDGWADISTGKGDPESTVLHEAVHRAEDLFLTPEERAALARAMPDAEARAEGIVRYAKEGKGLLGRARQLVARLLRRLRQFLGMPKDIDRLFDFYDRLLAGEYAKRQTVDSAGQPYVKSPGQAGNYDYRSDESVERGERSWNEAMGGAWQWVKTVLGKQPKDSNARPDLSQLDTLFRTIFHYAHKVPAVQRLLDAALRLPDDKHRFGESIFGEGEQDLGMIVKFSKANKAEWGRLDEYIRQRDMDAVGYSARRTDDGSWAVLGLEGQELARHPDEGAAWTHAHALEARDLVASGYSEDAARALMTYRLIADRMYRQLLGQVEELKNNLDKLGLDLPTVDDGEGGKTDIFAAMRKMGDRRGYYMPRIRTGRYLLHAEKEGEQPVTEAFDNPIHRRARRATLEGQGYKVNFSLSETPSEAAFLDLNLVALNDVVGNAIERLEKDGGKASLESFGMQAHQVQYQRKDGKAETHLVVTGPKRGTWSELFKDFGGRFYDDQQTGPGEAWHFVDPKPGLEEQLAKAVAAHQYGVVDLTEAFARTFAQEVAGIIHSRGSRKHKMGRSGAVGEDVRVGYDPDALRALTLAGKATAGGTAKRTMARTMMQIVTGNDIGWDAFKAKYMAENGVAPEGSGAMGEVWDAYRREVDERRIDSATQPNAYKEAISFMREMLRNEEGSERIFGALKGVAALKYLSGIAPGVVNLTALATAVPAAMKHFGNIPLGRAAGYLARGAANYAQHYQNQRWGKGEALTGEDGWLFSQISRRGWDEALQNMEAVGVLQGKLRGGWSKLVEVSLLPFSMTERLNRASTIAAAYYGLRAQGVDRDEALTKAKQISDSAHGVYGKTNLPAWARGANLGAQAARSFYMYKTFTHNYLQVLGKMGYGSLFGNNRRASAEAFAYMLLSPAILGGGAATLATPALALLAKALFAAFGAPPPDDPEEAFYRWLERQYGESAGRMARMGLPGLAGVNLKGSLAIGITDLPTSLKDILGAPYSLFEDVGYGARDILHGDLYKGAERLAPRFVKGPMQGFREATEGVTTHTNQPLYYGDERLRASWYDALLRSLSFNPSEISAKKDRQWKEREAEGDYRELRTVLYSRMRRFVLDGGDKGDWARILLDVERYNARVRASGYESIPYITETSIKTQLKRMDTPERRERLRAGLAEREDPGAIEWMPGEEDKGSARSSRSTGRRLNGRTVRREMERAGNR